MLNTVVTMLLLVTRELRDTNTLHIVQQAVILVTSTTVDAAYIPVVRAKNIKF